MMGDTSGWMGDRLENSSFKRVSLDVFCFLEIISPSILHIPKTWLSVKASAQFKTKWQCQELVRCKIQTDQRCQTSSGLVGFLFIQF